MPEWTDPHWLAAAERWIAERLHELDLQVVGPVEQPHLRPWSTVLCIPTSAGRVWFKANHPALAQEAAVVAVIAGRRGDLVPDLLALDSGRGWMLMGDGGDRLREVIARERSLVRWLEVLPLYAELQLELAGDVDRLLAAGARDRRLTSLPDAVEALPLGRDQVRQVRDWCAGLRAVPVPETIEHDDLHDGQVFVREGRYLFFDWGDACVTHPFCTLSVTLEGSIRFGLDDVADSVETAPFRDAYLEPFERFAPPSELREAADTAVRLGWVVRALFYLEAGEALDLSADRDHVMRRLRLAFDPR